jgi:hypothetical protein
LRTTGSDRGERRSGRSEGDRRRSGGSVREKVGSGGPWATIQMFRGAVLVCRCGDGSITSLPGFDGDLAAGLLDEEGVVGARVLRVGIADPLDGVDGLVTAPCLRDDAFDEIVLAGSI